ncbi:MAG: hypothetical protein ACOX87_07745, partial [Chloroflexota bacterium]
VELPARVTVALLVDKYGHEHQIASKDGKFFVDLEGATANTVVGAPDQFHIGGSPLLLVENKKLVTGNRTAPSQDWSAPGVDPNFAWVSPETGYTVSGEWLRYYQARGGADVLGHPLGTVREDPMQRGQIVQYFQNMVLEWHPNNPPEYRIQRKLLGNILYPESNEPAVNPDDPNNRPKGEVAYFPDEPGLGLGHYVSNYAPDGTPIYFKEFFDRYGGVDTFGYPKEEPKFRNGRWTQRFQGAEMEYYPENDREGVLIGTNTPYRQFRVQLAGLGERVLSELELPLDW